MAIQGFGRMVLLALAVCGVASSVSAQTVVKSSDTVKRSAPIVLIKPKGPNPIVHEVSLGFRLNTDGWSVYSDIGKAKTKDMRRVDMFHNVRLWQVEFTEKKDPREYKTTSDNGSGTNTYIFGKINNFYALKLGYGYRKLLVGKPDPGTVSIHWVNSIGVALGMEKPYYLNVLSDPSAIKYSDDTKTQFLDPDVIEGSAGFSKGLSEIKFIPGFYAKTALHFDFSANKKTVIAVEAGLNVEYYSSDIQLMANQSPTAYFADMYVGIQFGKRW
jgi:hypothetical protein